MSSPLGIPSNKGEVKVLIPPNIRDPLGLESECDPHLISPLIPETKKRKYKKKKLAHLAISPIVHSDDPPKGTALSGNSAAATVSKRGRSDATRPTHISIDPHISTSTGSNQSGTAQNRSTEAVRAAVQRKIQDKIVSPVVPQGQLKKIQDKIVSPVIPQTTSKRRKRKSSEGSDKDSVKSDKTSPHRPKYRKQSSGGQSASGKQQRRHSNKPQQQQQQQQQKNKQKDRFMFGESLSSRKLPTTARRLRKGWISLI